MSKAENELWVVGRQFYKRTVNTDPAYPEPLGYDFTWDFMGVFSSKEGAAACCKNQWWFIFPCMMDEVLPEELIDDSEVPNSEVADPYIIDDE